MDSLNTICGAVAVKEGKILSVGTTREIKKLIGDDCEIIDLKGKTLLPGFIDGHSHFSNFTRNESVNISPPPVGNVTRIADIIAALQKFRDEHNVNDGEWITAWGYDPDQMEERRDPVKEDLDTYFPNNPVILNHTSGHLSVANSAALKVAGIDRTTKDPAGGVIVRKQMDQEPTGLLQEKASNMVKSHMPKVIRTLEEQYQQLKQQQELYASFGITTAQDGNATSGMIEFYKKAAAQNHLFIDIEVLASFGIIDRLISDPDYKPMIRRNHLKIDGIKFYSDGSPQGRTAFFSKPYLTEVPGCDGECHGYPTVSQERFNGAVKKAFINNIHFYVHANGDSAIGMFIHAVEKANYELNASSTGRRTVVIHSQFVRPDQLDKYAQLGITPSFFSNHAFFWGNTHVKNLGVDRAYFLSPLNTALQKGIRYTNHTDFNVTPINQLFLLWTSVERQSRSGEIIGPDERISPMEGLRALTINGAYQYFEEKLKGSLEPGKLADMIILSDNPVTTDPDNIKDIVVLETIKEGRTVYKRGPSN